MKKSIASGTERGSFEFFDHTADVGIRVRAATLGGIFELAARAMTEIITEVQLISPRVQRTFNLIEEDLEILLVNWLQQLLYVFDTEGLIFGKFQAEVEEAALRATAWGEQFSADVHVVKTEIKAVTYHQLEVVQVKDGWQAQVIFDL
ncbi:MAG: archease [Deltaproteobacteria bacterium]|nr:archease [Deltaproteobacteria bacterium]MBW2070032.1 archease [Deltaproteobacteria bacterium]